MSWCKGNPGRLSLEYFQNQQDQGGKKGNKGNRHQIREEVLGFVSAAD
jgi:hypothetical protein